MRRFYRKYFTCLLYTSGLRAGHGGAGGAGSDGYRYQGAGYRGGYRGENAGQDSKACRNGPFDDDCGNYYRGHCGRDCSSRRDRTGYEEKGCKKVRKS